MLKKNKMAYLFFHYFVRETVARKTEIPLPPQYRDLDGERSEKLFLNDSLTRFGLCKD